MIKILKKKLIITLFIVATVTGISTQTFFMIQKEHTKKTQASNIKEKNTNEIAAVTSQNTLENNKSETSSISSNSEEQNENIDIKPQETINTKLENSSNNKDTNTQKVESSQTENNNTNKQEVINAQPEKTIYTDTQLNNTNTQPKEENNANIVPEEKTQNIFYYDRTTSIYDNDNITLLRREYYLNNKLAYYSVIEQFDSETNSYIEKIYNCNLETNIDPLIRTDIYSNGSIIQSY